MNRFEALRIFCVAAQSQNFREAATRLGVSPQVVTRSIRKLEDELGEPLFHRSTRGVRLTQFGEQLALRSAEAIANVENIFSSTTAATGDDTKGVVRIAAPSVLGRHFISKKLAPLLSAHSGLTIDLRLSEVRADVVDEQIDVGVRIGPMRDSRFVAKAVSPASLHIVAAPGLLARTGRPASIDALEDVSKRASGGC